MRVENVPKNKNAGNILVRKLQETVKRSRHREKDVKNKRVSYRNEYEVVSCSDDTINLVNT